MEMGQVCGTLVDEVGDEDDPEMPLGRFNASGPGRRLTEAQQEEEEAEQG
jgi:hypothetical protein